VRFPSPSGHGGYVALVDWSNDSSKVTGAEVADLGVAAGLDVEDDVALDPGPQLVHGGEGMAVEGLVSEDRPEALGTGAVIAGSGSAHGADGAELVA
jgi:hypothetical protein